MIKYIHLKMCHFGSDAAASVCGPTLDDKLTICWLQFHIEQTSMAVFQIFRKNPTPPATSLCVNPPPQ